MDATGVKHWADHFGGKVKSGLLIGAGILIMVLATDLRKSTMGFILGLGFLAAGIIGALKAILADKANRQRQKW